MLAASNAGGPAARERENGEFALRISLRTGGSGSRDHSTEGQNRQKQQGAGGGQSDGNGGGRRERQERGEARGRQWAGGAEWRCGRNSDAARFSPTGCSGPLDEHRSTITPTLKSGR